MQIDDDSEYLCWSDIRDKRNPYITNPILDIWNCFVYPDKKYSPSCTHMEFLKELEKISEC